MDAVIEILTSRLPRLLYPFTIGHLLLFLVASYIAFYSIETVLRITWFRSLYIAFLVITLSSMWQQGDKKEIAKDIFKLAMV
jgi:hypothetical protein